MKKILSLLLAFILITMSVPALAESEDSITVFISINSYGEIVTDKNGDMLAYSPVTLTGKDTYTLDDAFREAHLLYHPDGESGYTSSVGDLGLGVDKLWGDTSYNFGYQVNGGVISVMGPAQELNDGDVIDAYIYDYTNQSYAKFNSRFFDTSIDAPINLELSSVSGFDENWNNLFSPCADATITINGIETEILTDENGMAELIFDEEGTYIVSAKKTKTVEDKTFPVITAPVCIITVSEAKELRLIHNIADYYANCDFEMAGGNLPWIVADMAVYEKLYPESQSIFSDQRKAEALDYLINFAESAETPGDLAKTILAIRSLGYDTENIYTSSFETLSLAEELISLTEDAEESVTNIYTLPYVIIALSQSNEYNAEEYINKLISFAKASSDEWMDVTYGTDALAPMVLALAPYYSFDDEIKDLLDNSIEILKGEQRDDGLIDGFEGYESASTGLVLCAFSALGINPDEIKNNELSLIDGLLSVANSELNGFSNEFAREQGFRGLLSWQLLNSEEIIYNFSEYPLNEINVLSIKNCPVKFEVSPQKASVKIENAEEISDGLFDLPEGEYSYTVSASGYKTQSGIFTVSSNEAENRTLKTISLTLSKKQSSGGGGGGSSSGSGNKAENSEDEKEETKTETPETTKPDDIKPESSLNINNIFADVDNEAWYYPAVQYVYENRLISGTDKGFEPNSYMTRGMLVTVLHRLSASKSDPTSKAFSDVSADKWYYDGVCWAVDNGIASGVSKNLFAPDENITREQIATIIYRFAKYCGYNTDSENKSLDEKFADTSDISEFAIEAVRYISSANIMQGRDNNNFSPKENATRAEVSTILMRFMEAYK